jgi:hypothetical protein
VEMDIMEIARKAIATPSLITLFRPAIWWNSPEFRFIFPFLIPLAFEAGMLTYIFSWNVSALT